jgi:hypothetical protein
MDKHGNHLRVWGDGRFACVVNTGSEGAQHRKRIFALIGVKDGKGVGGPVIQPKVISRFFYE